MTDLRDATTRRLHRTVLDRQRSGRLPGVFAGVVRGGGLVWQEGIGAAHLDDPDTPPDADHQFLVASNTKTFTAVLVMALRDEGRLSLDDTARHVRPRGHPPGPHHPAVPGARVGHAARAGRRRLGDAGQP